MCFFMFLQRLFIFSLNFFFLFCLLFFTSPFILYFNVALGSFFFLIPKLCSFFETFYLFIFFIITQLTNLFFISLHQLTIIPLTWSLTTYFSNLNLLLLNSINNFHPVGVLILQVFFLLIPFILMLDYFFIRKLSWQILFYYIRFIITLSVFTFILGLFWSYQSLGWDGWWAWDISEFEYVFYFLFFLFFYHITLKEVTLVVFLFYFIILLFFYWVNFSNLFTLHSFELTSPYIFNFPFGLSIYLCYFSLSFSIKKVYYLTTHVFLYTFFINIFFSFFFNTTKLKVFFFISTVFFTQTLFYLKTPLLKYTHFLFINFIWLLLFLFSFKKDYVAVLCFFDKPSSFYFLAFKLYFIKLKFYCFYIFFYSSSFFSYTSLTPLTNRIFLFNFFSNYTFSNFTLFLDYFLYILY